MTAPSHVSNKPVISKIPILMLHGGVRLLNPGTASEIRSCHLLVRYSLLRSGFAHGTISLGHCSPVVEPALDATAWNGFESEAALKG